jgi:hypothetical protein
MNVTARCTNCGRPVTVEYRARDNAAEIYRIRMCDCGCAKWVLLVESVRGRVMESP